MAERPFALEYDGPALASGQMDVKDLAPALLALSEALQASNTLLFANEPPVRLKVVATKRGSFDLNFVLEQAQTVAALTLPSPEILNGLLDAFKGLISLIKRFGHKQPEDFQEVTPGVFRISESEKTTKLDLRAMTLFRNSRVRTLAGDVISPLRTEGVEEVRLKKDGSVLVKVSKSDLPKFELPPATRALDASSRDDTRILSIQSVSFKEKNKWRFSEGLGGGSFPARITDPSFLARIDAGEKFGKGDKLRARVRTEQTLTPEGELRTSKEITEVVEHIPRPVQDSF